LKFHHRILFLLAPIWGFALSGGCASKPPAQAFERGLATAGISQPIRFVVTGMPTDITAVPDDRTTLTLDEAVRRTLANDPAVQAALARTRAALADARQARLLPNPVVSVAFRFPEGGAGKPIIDASLAADLISLLLKPRQVNAADRRLRAASSEALTTVLDTLADVQDRYVAVQALDAQMGNLDERMKLVRRLLDLARSRVRAGESGRLDVITLDSERAALDVEITQTALEQREQRLALSRLMGQPSGAAGWTLTPWSPPPPLRRWEPAWVATALERRPEVQARRWELVALGDEAAIAGLGALEGSQVGVDSERDGTWSVGPAFSLPIPLLDWGQARRAKVEAQRIEARHLLTQTRRQVVEEVRRAIAALQASEAALGKARTELIPLADQRREQAEASYRNGFADITAVLLAEQDAQGARAKLIELQQKVSTARFRLQRAAGGPAAVPEITTTQPTPQALTEQP
jgi:outer membrane protein TolC